MADTLQTFSDLDHARCVAAGRRAIADFDHGVRASGLPECLQVMGRQSAWQLALITRRLQGTLPAGPWSMRDGVGRWREATTLDGAIEVLLPRILDKGLGHGVGDGRPPVAALYRRLCALTASRLGRGRKWALTPTGKLKLGFGSAFERAGFSVGSLRTTEGGWGDYARLWRGFRSGRAGLAIPPLPADSPEVRGAMAALTELQGRYSDPLVRSAWRLYLPYLARNASSMLALVADGPELMQRLDAAFAVGYEANSWLSAALLEAARRGGRPGVVVNHNSHRPAQTPIADAVLETLFRQRTDNPLVSLAGHWSMALPAPPVRNPQTKVAFYRAEYPGASPRSGTRFRLLHAGNYQNWSDFFPWVSETADEYLRGLRRLADAAAGIPDIELVIRVRLKAEVDADVVRRAVPEAANVTVVTTDTDFLTQLAESDLLVSHFSTTVEQALQMGKPVLLWGSAHRYCQVPPRLGPPTSGSRAAVYAVQDARDLPAMLASLRAHHSGRPLTDSEVAPFRIPADRPDVHGFARTVARELGLP